MDPYLRGALALLFAAATVYTRVLMTHHPMDMALVAAQIPPLDVMPAGWTLADADKLLQTVGVAGCADYIDMHATLDFVFPLHYACMFIWLLYRGASSSSLRRSAVLLPVIAAVCDLAENVAIDEFCLARMAATSLSPLTTALVFVAGHVLTPLKFVCLPSCVLVLVWDGLCARRRPAVSHAAAAPVATIDPYLRGALTLLVAAGTGYTRLLLVYSPNTAACTAANVAPLDRQLWWTAAGANEALNSMGQAGAATYLDMHSTLDAAFPMLYASLLAMLVFVPGGSHASPLRRAAVLLPVLAACFDMCENAGIDAFVREKARAGASLPFLDPATDAGVLIAGCVCTPLKWVGIVAAVGIVVWEGVARVVRYGASWGAAAKAHRE